MDRSRSNAEDVDALLSRLPAGTRRTVSALRALVRRIAPDARETVLWGSLSYHRPSIGGRVKGAVCLVTAKRGAVRLELVHGVRLPDPDRLLRGSARSKRYVPITSARDATRPEIADLLAAAASLAWPAAARRERP